MNYSYPPHFKYPDTEKIYFGDHINLWESVLGDLKNKPNITLEIGALYGGSSVYILEEFCKHPGSTHFIMDINKNAEEERRKGCTHDLPLHSILFSASSPSPLG
jgi:cephalosporin hydroxylase